MPTLVKATPVEDAYAQWENNGTSPFLPIVEANNGNYVTTDKHENLLMFGSCDYLGLSQEPELAETAIQAIRDFGTNTYGAQLLIGHTRIHHELEAHLAALGSAAAPTLNAAILFPSGMSANLAVISTLASKDDIIINDRTDHISIFMGSTLSGAEVRTFPHNNMVKLEALLAGSQDKRRRIIIVDGLYSADGDYAPLDRIAVLAKKYDAMLIVDEAHAIGIIGKHGLGVSEFYGVLDSVDAIVGTMSKGLGSTGGFVLTRTEIEKELRYMAPSYTSSRGSAPAVAAASLAGVKHLAAHGDRLRAQLENNVALVITGLRAAGLDILNTRSHIVPVMVRDEDKTIQVANWLMEHGIFTAAFVFPHVPANTGRLRIGLTARHSQQDCERLIALLIEAKRLFQF